MRVVARGTLVVALLIALRPFAAHAHDPLNDLPAPTSAGEAWNVMTQSLANVERCLETNQFKEVATHVSNCSRALRLLQAEAQRRNDKPLSDGLESLYYSGDAIITATRSKDAPLGKARAALAAHQAAVKAVAARYPADVLAAQVYNCPMHPLELSLDPATPCPKCSMKLIRRRIPASTTYERPGEPSMKLTAAPDRPLHPGRPAAVTLTLARNDGTPVTRKDLLTMHTEKIHLLIVDRSLADYHHEHPTPTDTPGQYTFSFTPKLPGPYRVFADLVPAETSVQEYVVADIPGGAPPQPIGDTQTRLTASVDGFTFTIRFDVPTSAPTPAGPDVPANQPVTGRLAVTTAGGQPFGQLEPVMGAFAHLVAFNEDRKTVLHIHPDGPEPQSPDQRGGPALSFKFYAPTPGFYRLYAQTQIGGRQVFAPFNVRVRK